jgi:hypothetical protein
MPATEMAKVPEDPEANDPGFLPRLTHLAYATALALLALVLTLLVA